MDKEKFRKIIGEGVSVIPEKFLKMLDNVEITIAEAPTLVQLKKAKIPKGGFLFGLYEGVPKTKRWNYSQVLPDKITIFQKPIEEVAKSEKEIRDLVKKTIWHEIAHHFGIDEKKVREIEKKRDK